MTVTRMAGLLAPLLYAIAVLAGGLAMPGFDHASQPISALMAGYSGPWWVYGLFSSYNALLAVFALGQEKRWLRAALLASAIVGLGMLALPMDLPDAPVSLAGGAHIVLAGLAALLSMLSIGAGAAASTGAMRGWSWLALAVVFATGALAAIGTAQGWPIAGLLERLTIGTFLVWVAGWALATS